MIVVSDTSALSALFLVGQLDLLNQTNFRISQKLYDFVLQQAGE